MVNDFVANFAIGTVDDLVHARAMGTLDTETRDDPRQQRVQLRYEDYLAKPGRKVRIIRGPFAGIYGEIKTIKSHRVVVVKLPELKIANGITHVSKSDLVILEDETMPSRSTSAI